WIFFSLILTITISTTVQGKALRSPVQTGEEIIVAKGDIPTPEKYPSSIQTYLNFANAELS
ncbi:hypothetical protein NP569_27165, partial [Vibrio parahaemolyticus]|nr:hypothetical protein [Vibrio parahaemolyticus]